MKKIILIFFLISGCSYDHNQKISDISQIEFSDNLTLEEFKIKLEEYTANSTYPNIDN
tara:strand:+ start:1472 stop:1645 length:174 start_codon:yes stop_codon:yes gene_type:complete